MRISALFLSLLVSNSAAGQELIVGTLNTESAFDTLTFNVGKTMIGVGFVDVWALQEVTDANALKDYTVAAGSAPGRKSFRMIQSVSGQIDSQHRRSDFLAIVYNSSALREVETTELHSIRSIKGTGRLGKSEWGLRGALFARFQHRDSGVEFYVGNVHLKCCGPNSDPTRNGPDIRAHQSRLLKNWIDQRDVPVILTGDFNIPIAPDDSNGPDTSVAFKTLTESLMWHRPVNPIKTQCSKSFNSMLDHYFTTASANLNIIDVKIGNPESSYCDNETDGGADHRPVIARFSIGN